MQTVFRITASTAAALLAAVGIARAEVVETRVLEETVPVTGSEPVVVVVKNIIGSVRVIGHDRDRVEMRATETIRGDLKADIDRARAEVELKTESEPGRVAFRVRPVGADDDCHCRGERWDGYRVEYDIEVRVPRGATLDLSTVSDGDVTAEGVEGNFTVANVNGRIELAGVAGSGSVHTVNGNVEARFERAPAGPTSFRTVNGDLDVAFPDNLSADLQFATMQGDVFTDFEVASLTQAPTVNRDGSRGRFVMRANRASSFRIGAGGDKLSFNTLNGDIYVRRANQ